MHNSQVGRLMRCCRA